MLLKPNQIFCQMVSTHVVVGEEGQSFSQGYSVWGIFRGVCRNSPLEHFPILVLINFVFSSILRSKLKYFDEVFLLYFCNFHQVLIEEKV